MSWELFEEGCSKTIASLYGSSRTKRLSIGVLLRGAGFDVTKRYALYFDRSPLRIGLAESSEPHAKKIYVSNATSSSQIYMGGFCAHFGITDQLTAYKFERDESGMWVLYLRKADKKAASEE
jgi:hypothetical protein